MKKLFFLFFSCLIFSQLTADDLTWDSPTTLSTSMVDASDPQIIMDVNGNTTAVWIEAGVVIANYRAEGGSWGTSAAVPGSSDSSSPRLGVDASGNVTAVWLEIDVVTTSTSVAGSWGSAASISSSGATLPAIAVRDNGDMVVVWERSGFIESATKLNAGMWSGVSSISGMSAGSDNPDVAVGSNGTVVAVWHTSSGADIVISATKPIAGSWGSPMNIISVASGYSHNYPKVDVDTNGNAIVIWYRYQSIGTDYINVAVFSSNLPFGGVAWTPLPTILAGPGIRNPADLSAKVRYDAAGNAVGIWSISFDNSLFTIQSSLRLLGKEWGQILPLVTPAVYAFNGDVATNSLGSAVAAYMFFDGTFTTIQAAEANIGGALPDLFWSTPINISPSGNNGYPKVTSVYKEDMMVSQIYAAAAWLNSDGVTTSVQVATAAKTPVDPPTDLDVSQDSADFGIFIDYFNTITWTASSDPSIIEYVVYRNGIVFQAVDAFTFEAVEHDTIQMGTVQYGVAAVNNEGAQSKIVPITIFP